jgi:hypothetical protein
MQQLTTRKVGGDLSQFCPDFFLVRAALFALVKGYHRKLVWDYGLERDGENCYPLPYFNRIKVKTTLNSQQIDDLEYGDFFLDRIDFWNSYFGETRIFVCVGRLRDEKSLLNVAAEIPYNDMVQMNQDLVKGKYDGFDSGDLLEQLMLPPA